MTLMDDLCRFIWLRPGLDATGIEWRECLGEAAWNQLPKKLFARGDVGAVCRRADHDRMFRVAPHGNDYQLVCETTGYVEATGVAEADVRTYRLNPTAFGKIVRSALGVVAEPGSVAGAPRAFPLGEWRLVETAALPTFLILPPTTQLLMAEVQRLLVEITGGFVLLVPQRPTISTHVREQLERKHAMVVPLLEVIEWDGARFAATPGWESYRNAYCAKHLPNQMVPAPPHFEWRKVGDYWSIRYAGEFTTIKDAVGLAYIAQLLPRPRQKVFAPDLLEAITGHSSAKQTGSAGEQADKQTLDDVKQKYLDTQAELEEAERNNDLAAQDRLQRELDGLTDYLKTVKGFNGRTREASDDADKIRRAMTQAIGRVIDSLVLSHF